MRQELAKAVKKGMKFDNLKNALDVIYLSQSRGYIPIDEQRLVDMLSSFFTSNHISLNDHQIFEFRRLYSVQSLSTDQKDVHTWINPAQIQADLDILPFRQVYTAVNIIIRSIDQLKSLKIDDTDEILKTDIQHNPIDTRKIHRNLLYMNSLQNVNVKDTELFVYTFLVDICGMKLKDIGIGESLDDQELTFKINDCLMDSNMGTLLDKEHPDSSLKWVEHQKYSMIRTEMLKELATPDASDTEVQTDSLLHTLTNRASTRPRHNAISKSRRQRRSSKSPTRSRIPPAISEVSDNPESPERSEKQSKLQAQELINRSNIRDHIADFPFTKADLNMALYNQFKLPKQSWRSYKETVHSTNESLQCTAKELDAMETLLNDYILSTTIPTVASPILTTILQQQLLRTLELSEKYITQKENLKRLLEKHQERKNAYFIKSCALAYCKELITNLEIPNTTVSNSWNRLPNEKDKLIVDEVFYNIELIHTLKQLHTLHKEYTKFCTEKIPTLLSHPSLNPSDIKGVLEEFVKTYPPSDKSALLLWAQNILNGGKRRAKKFIKVAAATAITGTAIKQGAKMIKSSSSGKWWDHPSKTASFVNTMTPDTTSTILTRSRVKLRRRCVIHL